MNSNLAPLARICTTRLRALLTVFTVTLLVTSVRAATEKVLHKFNNTDGAIPFSSLIFDAAGNLYGTTVDGGNTASCDSDGCGTVFELTPKTGGGWKETVLHRFVSGTKDGHFPHAGVVFDASGNLYGTTAFGGSGPCTDGCGTVFELMPPKSGGWTEKLLHSFTGKDGRYAEAALVFDASGNLYGTTPVGGAYDYGTVFELTRKSGGTWAAKVLHSFKDGYGSYGSLVFDSSGNLYGTTGGGGTYNYGTVFELTPSAGGQWTETVLHNFNGTDGLQPLAGLILNKGVLYGTTLSGGAYGGGTVFEVSLKTGAAWAEKVLYSFCYSFFHSCPNGSGPQASLIVDASGNLFGTTASGGSTRCSEVGCGTVFEVTPDGSGGWTEHALYGFGRQTGGIVPEAGLIFDATGNLYGTASNNGAGYGTGFEIMR